MLGVLRLMALIDGLLLAAVAVVVVVVVVLGNPVRRPGWFVALPPLCSFTSSRHKYAFGRL